MTGGQHDRRAKEGARARPGMSPQQIETWVDQTIRQAQRRGDFDDLPGAGKPLASLDQPTDPDWWIKDLIKREKVDLSAALPGPMALRRERETYPDALLHLSDERVVREVFEDFNARVVADRKRPHVGPGSPVVVGRVDVDLMTQRWQQLRAAMAPPATVGDAEQHQLVPPDRPRRRMLWWWGRREAP